MIADVIALVMGVMAAGLILGWTARPRWDRDNYLSDQSEILEPAEGDELLPELPDWDDATLGVLHDERTDDEGTVLYLREEDVVAGETVPGAGVAADSPAVFPSDPPVLIHRSGTGRRDRRDWHKRRGLYSSLPGPAGARVTIASELSGAVIPAAGADEHLYPLEMAQAAVGRAGEFHSSEERVITLAEAGARAAAWLARDEFAVWEAEMTGLINGAWQWFHGAGRWEIAA
jgi:hypothetical protein